MNLSQVIARLNPLLRGVGNYFRVANCKKEFQRLVSWIRRRLRAIQMKLWKKPKRLHRRLHQRGYQGEFDEIRMNSWANASSPLCHNALPNGSLNEELGVFDLGKVTTGYPVQVK